MLEDLLGIQLKDGKLHFNPCLPEGWSDINVTYCRDWAIYEIIIHQGEDGDGGGDGKVTVTVNGEKWEAGV